MNRFAFINLLKGYLRIVLGSLFHRKLRASLTIVGIVIGISIILTLVFLGNGLERSITRQLRQFGSDLIFLLPNEAGNPLAQSMSRGEFSRGDLRAVESVSGIASVMPIISGKLLVASFRGEEKTVSAEGRPRIFIEDIVEDSLGIHLAQGRWMQREDSREVVIGSRLASKGFKEPIHVGETIDIRGRRLLVTGILQPFGDNVRDTVVIMTVGLMQDLTGVRDRYSGMLAKVAPGEDIEAVGTDLRDTLSRRSDLEEYSVLTPAKSEEVISKVIGTVQSALFLIATVAVIVAGIGVMNTMYTSVLERTREIGIMKAVGAKGWHVMLVFLIESMLLGIIGGILGIFVGAGLAEVVAWYARGRGYGFFESAVDVKTIVFVFAFTMVVGLLAGVLPARQAAKKKPVEALMYR